MQILVFPDLFTVHQLAQGTQLKLLSNGTFEAIIYANDEVTWVTTQSLCAEAMKSEHGWRLLKLNAIIDFSEIGVLAKLSDVLAKAQISIFALSTFNTDYILVRDTSLVAAIEALTIAGYKVA